MRRRLDSPSPSAVPRPRLRYAGLSDAFPLNEPAPDLRSQPHYGPTCDLLFAKGGMSILLLIALVITPFVMALSGPRLFAAPHGRQVLFSQSARNGPVNRAPGSLPKPIDRP